MAIIQHFNRALENIECNTDMVDSDDNEADEAVEEGSPYKKQNKNSSAIKLDEEKARVSLIHIKKNQPVFQRQESSKSMGISKQA
jgi:hypothetical protein